MAEPLKDHFVSRTAVHLLSGHPWEIEDRSLISGTQGPRVLPSIALFHSPRSLEGSLTVERFEQHLAFFWLSVS